MVHRLAHLNSGLLRALNPAALPDIAPLAVAGITALDVKRTCRLLEERIGRK